jgi:hypothetical protein
MVADPERARSDWLERSIAGVARKGRRSLMLRVTHRNHGADDRIRTGDLLITNQLLYQLSYVGLRAWRGAGGARAGGRTAPRARHGT